MEQIERYLDQACRGIAGPRALRNHIRQELREHLLDALAQHKSAGLPDDDALARALEDFGGSDLVRSELEATHGHRLMTLVLDKALQWKEKTMKARWLWTTLAHTALLLTIALELLLIVGVIVFLFPKYNEMVRWGAIVDGPHTTIVAWSIHYLTAISDVVQNALWYIIPIAAAWILFEWRARTENKSFIRLSVLGFFSVGLMVAAMFTTAAMSLPFLIVLTTNTTTDGSEQLVADRLDSLDRSMAQLDQFAATSDWPGLQDHAMQFATDQYNSPLYRLPFPTPAVLVLSRHRDDIARLRANYRDSHNALLELASAATTKDPARIKAALQKLHTAYDPLHQYAQQSLTPTTAP